MDEIRYKIVFNGEIGFGYELAEVKENFHKNCGFSRETVERLFSGGNFILKKDVDEATAHKFRDLLQRQGAFCEVVPLNAPAPAQAAATPTSPVPPSTPALATTPATPRFSCPACGQLQDEGETCVACGIIFEKYARVQAARRARDNALMPELATTPAKRAVTGHQRFLLQCAAVTGGAALLQMLIGWDFMVFGWIILPIVFLGYLALQAAAGGESFPDVMEENIALLHEQRAAEEPRPWFPVVTYGLVLLQLLLYYGVVLQVEPQVLVDNFAFYPAVPSALNTVTGALTALVLHGDGWQLWGCIVALCVIGAAAEQTLGRLPFLGLYFVGGMLANVAGGIAHRLLLGDTLHTLGASGALAVLLGWLLLRTPGQTITFPVPLVGALTLVTPRTLALKLSLFAVTGAFIFANLFGGIDPQSGAAGALVGHLAHVAGIALGMAAGLILPGRMPEPQNPART